MKILYGFAVSVLWFGSIFAADVSKQSSLRQTAVFGSGYDYPSKPDSEEKMALSGLLKAQGPRIGEFRADSPYPAELAVMQPDGTVQLREQKPQPLSKRNRNDSVSSYGSVSTISIDTPGSVETPTIAQSEEPIK